MPVLSPQGKNAIITGGGSGINLAFAKALHEAGCGVLVADLSIHHDGEEWLKTRKGRAGPNIVFQKTDVSDWRQLEEVFNVFAKEFGGAPDIVVAGAGVYEASFKGFWDVTDDLSHYKLFDINLLHPIKITRMAIRRLCRAEKPGVILHLSSITAQKPSITLPLYSVSKAGISQFVRCMARLDELSGIRVVAVAPGVVNTPLFRDHPDALAHIDMEKDFVLPPDEIVKAMMALVADPKYPSGTVLEVGDISEWREVKLLNDGGPQGRATLSRDRAQNAVINLKETLKRDREGLS